MTQKLLRSIKTPGAILMGMGSIIGTGLFVSIAIATQIAGDGIIIAIIIAAVLATLNGLSSAQLAAAHPVSGGTYEYGYKYLGSYFGFTAGWMFVTAKTASAATAVLGCVGYIVYLFDIDLISWLYPLSGIGILLLMTLLVSGGIKRSNLANMGIVSITLIGLAALVVFGFGINGLPTQPIRDSFAQFDVSSILYASALMFVAYTGYGRIATLGEEVINPRYTIPRAIILSMILIVIIYLTVALTSLQILGSEAFGQTVEGEAAPLMVVAQALQIPGLGWIVSIAAVTAMLGVLLNLLLGISRVILAMARRKDLPNKLSEVKSTNQSPVAAVITTGVIIGLFVLSGDVVFTWSFSAFTVLIYYSITNLSALMLPEEDRLYSKWIPVGGLFGCLFLAFWIDPAIWSLGVGMIIIGLLWHTVKLKMVS
ncbi:MAG: APC family permease [Balneolaceae bacterium]